MGTMPRSAGRLGGVGGGNGFGSGPEFTTVNNGRGRRPPSGGGGGAGGATDEEDRFGPCTAPLADTRGWGGYASEALR